MLFPIPAQLVVLKDNYTRDLHKVAKVIPSEDCPGGEHIDRPRSLPTQAAHKQASQGLGSTARYGRLGPFLSSVDFTTKGYWDPSNSRQVNPPAPVIGDSPTRLPFSTAFIPGVYTVAVAD